MAGKIDDKNAERLVRNGKFAGAIPAEPTHLPFYCRFVQWLKCSFQMRFELVCSKIGIKLACSVYPII